MLVLPFSLTTEGSKGGGYWGDGALSLCLHVIPYQDSRCSLVAQGDKKLNHREKNDDTCIDFYKILSFQVKFKAV